MTATGNAPRDEPSPEDAMQFGAQASVAWTANHAHHNGLIETHLDVIVRGWRKFIVPAEV